MKRTIVFIFTLIVSIPIESQSIRNSITKELSQISKSSSLVGFGAAIVNKESIIYAKGFGYANKDTKKAYTIHTQQPIASVSKTLLAVALMKAQELGKLNLKDDINSHLPFHIVNPYFPNDNITIQQLVNHTSGLIDRDSYDYSYVFKNKISPFYNSIKDKDLKTEIEKSVKLFHTNEMMPLGEFIKRQYVKDQTWYNKNQGFLNHRPGSSYEYSNMGANISAYIIEQVTGEKYVEFIQKHILNPLQMNNSGWRGKNFDPKNTSTLYWYGYPIPDYDLITYPDGSLMTSIVDYSKFLSAMIGQYENEGVLLTDESFKEMIKPTISSASKKGVFWSIDSEKIGHSGSDPGILVHAYFLKETCKGIIVFTNTSDTKNGATEVRDIYRTLLKYAKKL